MWDIKHSKTCLHLRVFTQDIDSVWQNVAVNSCQVGFLKFISFQEHGGACIREGATFLKIYSIANN